MIIRSSDIIEGVYVLSISCQVLVSFAVSLYNEQWLSYECVLTCCSNAGPFKHFLQASDILCERVQPYWQARDDTHAGAHRQDAQGLVAVTSSYFIFFFWYYMTHLTTPRLFLILSYKSYYYYYYYYYYACNTSVAIVIMCTSYVLNSLVSAQPFLFFWFFDRRCFVVSLSMSLQDFSYCYCYLFLICLLKFCLWM